MIKRFGDLTLREIARSPNDDVTCIKECLFMKANCRKICAETGVCLVDKIKELDDYLDVRIEVSDDEQKEN